MMIQAILQRPYTLLGTKSLLFSQEIGIRYCYSYSFPFSSPLNSMLQPIFQILLFVFSCHSKCILPHLFSLMYCIKSDILFPISLLNAYHPCLWSILRTGLQLPSFTSGFVFHASNLFSEFSKHIRA